MAPDRPDAGSADLLAQGRGSRRHRDGPALAVLPFATDADVPRLFSDGVTEDVITELSRFRELLVVGYGSSSGYAAAGTEPGRVAQELGVRYLLQGTVRRSPTRIRISSHLIDTAVGNAIWSNRHDAPPGDLLQLQESVAASIAGAIAAEIASAEHRRAETLSRTDMAAYELALRAGTAINRGTAQADVAMLTQGITLAQDALAIDPECRRAAHALAMGFCRRGVVGGIGAERSADLDAADAAALRLRDIDPSDHSAYAVLGHVAMRRLRHDEALSNLRRAHALNPNDVVTLRWLSWEESNHGLSGPAADHATLALRLGPRDRAIDASHWTLALAAYVAGDCEGAIRHVGEAISLNRRFGGHAMVLAACLAETGRLEEAREVVAQLRQSNPGLLQSRLAGRTYFVAPGLAERYRQALRRAAQGGGAGGGTDRARPVLTGREVEVLRLVARGLGNAEVATELGLSEHTAKRHVANILTRLDLPTRAAAVAAAARLGLLSGAAGAVLLQQLGG